MDFINYINRRGVKNMEMEGLAFGSFTGSIKVKSACLSVVIVNRLKEDSIDSS
jgi:uridine phosphorylase